MYTDRIGPLRKRGTDPQRQVVVKLKTTRPTRGVLSAAATEGRMPRKKGALERELGGPKVLAMEPIFGKAPSRSLEPFRRMALAAESEPDSDLYGLNVITLLSRDEATKVCARIEKDPLVDFAYVIPERYPLAARRARASQDPMLNRQWGLRAIELFQAEQGAGFKDPRDVLIAVIDSGVDSGHPDLEGIFMEERSFTTGSSKDTSGHGTHVCGIIAAIRNNQRGIRGVVQSTKVMSLKALDPYSGPGYYRALRHATERAQIINLSIGGGYDPTEELLVRRAIKKRVNVIAAMGNEKQEGNPRSYPAAIGGVIAVGASTESDGIADFSNTGTHIDLVAPGVNILSTVPTYPTRLADGTHYEAWPGTSMAAPHVAAVAALLLAKRPAASVARVRKALVRGADKVPGQRKFNATFGHGRLNVRQSLKLI